MGEKAQVFDDVKTPAIADMGDDYFIDITVECAELHDPWDVDYISSPQKLSQCGIFEDGEGEQIRFKAWNGSDPPVFEEGETYNITDMQMVYGANADSYAFVIRSKTEASDVSGFPSSVGDRACKYCGAELTDEQLHHGPEAPEIGWDYYECPDCGKRMRPGSV